VAVWNACKNLLADVCFPSFHVGLRVLAVDMVLEGDEALNPREWRQATAHEGVSTPALVSDELGKVGL
jgi:hypothetical protein